LLISPLFAIFAPASMFAAAAVAIPLLGVTGAAVAHRLEGRVERRPREIWEVSP
jgi:hypothetical protein